MTERQVIKAMQEQLEAVYDALINEDGKLLEQLRENWECFFCTLIGLDNKKFPCKTSCPIYKAFDIGCCHDIYNGSNLFTMKGSHNPDNIDTLIGGCEFMLTKGK